MNPFIGVVLHAVGGFFHGSFYVPLHRVKRWQWETAWITQGLAAWIVSPAVVALMTCPNLQTVYANSPVRNMVLAYLFGAMWGAGSLTFGLSMRFLGMALGMSIALGYCTAFGTLIPPLVAGDAGTLLTTTSGLTVLIGVAVCLGGIAVCCYAGTLKERELTDQQKRAAIKEFALTKGLFVATFSGIMSAGFAYGIDAGKPIAEAALQAGVPSVFQNSPVFVLVMGGGFTVNFIWCSILILKNKSASDFFRGPLALMMPNYFFSVLAGVMWYTGFFFYGMGTTKMGRYDFSSWSIHLAFVIVFSNLCGLLCHEWKGSSRKTFVAISAGLIVLILSTIVIGYGSQMASGH